MLRCIEILYVFVRYLLFSRGKSMGERIRLALQRLGIVFIKLGQALAVQEVFTRSINLELEKLWDAVTPLPFSTIKSIVERSVGPIDNFFDHFEEAPYASASMAQTHVAYPRGHKAIVKVRRPDVLGKMAQDLGILKFLVRVGSLVSRTVWCVKSARIPEQVEAWLREEADFPHEAHNVGLFAEAYQGSAIVVPQVLHVSQDVLIETFLSGIPCNKWRDATQTEGYDPQASVRALLSETLGRRFSGIAVPMHGDPHPANLIIMKGGKIGVVDYGRIGFVTERNLFALNRMVFAIYVRHPKGVVEWLLRLSNFSHLSGPQREALEGDMVGYVEECHVRPFDYWIIGLGRILFRHGIPAPDSLTLTGCFGVFSNKVAQMFFPGSSTFDLVGDEIRRGMYKQVLGQLVSIDPLTLLYTASCFVDAASSSVTEFARDPFGAVPQVFDRIAALVSRR